VATELVYVAMAARAQRVMWRDARSHASPNAGWAEAVCMGLRRERGCGDRHPVVPGLGDLI